MSPRRTIDPDPKPFTPEEYLNLALSKEQFWWFLDGVFIKSFEGATFYSPGNKSRLPFGFSALHHEWALLVQYCPRLCLQAARGHLKTTVFGQGFPFWHMVRAAEPNSYVDIMYFSYKAELANEKVGALKRLIKENTYCRFWRDLKPSADSIINYLVDWGEGPVAEVVMRGSGISSATRGRHPGVTICDDILSDFSNPLSSTELSLINRIFRNVIMSLPSNPQDPLVLVGTPQAYTDILYQLARDEEWMWVIYPAIISEAEQTTQWPEKYDYGRLQRIRKSIREAAFLVEYMLVPVTVTDQFLTQEIVAASVDPQLKLWNLGLDFSNPEHLGVYAGLDIGKTAHPSHVIVFLELPSKTLVPLYHTFLDHVDYPQQVKILNFLATRFKLLGLYDKTNNVLEDRGLSRRWRGRQFSRRMKGNLATLLAKRLFADEEDAGIVLPGDERYISQLCAVRRDLSAPETSAGHGDSFWSTALAVRAAEDGPGLVEIGSGDTRLPQ